MNKYGTKQTTPGCMVSLPICVSGVWLVVRVVGTGRKTKALRILILFGGGTVGINPRNIRKIPEI